MLNFVSIGEVILVSRTTSVNLLKRFNKKIRSLVNLLYLNISLNDITLMTKKRLGQWSIIHGNKFPFKLYKQNDIKHSHIVTVKP